MELKGKPRALLFDVFGTCVDWRSSVTDALDQAAREVLVSPTPTALLGAQVKADRMSKDFWGDFAQQWRNSYKSFTKSIADNPSISKKTVDEHHLDALQQLLASSGLEGLWTMDEMRELSFVWHRLKPWPDSEEGLKVLNLSYPTCSLSNANPSLLEDLTKYAKLEFTHLFSAEDFGTFKPNSAVYLGAARKLEISPTECAMVAAHLNDLQAAKSHGYQTIYIERPLEEDLDAEEIARAKTDGTVDVWISASENGILTVAQRLASMRV